MFDMLLRAWRYRHFIFSSIKNEFLSRFARSRLGALWMVIYPPLIVPGSALVNNVLLFVAILAVFALLGHQPGWHTFWLVFNVVNIDKTQFAGCLWNEPHISIESLTQ